MDILKTFQRVLLPFTIGDGTTTGSVYGNNKDLKDEIKQEGYEQKTTQTKKSKSTKKKAPQVKTPGHLEGKISSNISAGEKNCFGGCLDLSA